MLLALPFQHFTNGAAFPAADFLMHYSELGNQMNRWGRLQHRGNKPIECLWS